ncbi:hypothetical protein BDK51DRAFT_25558, partial [Blyttiomyces helicus]
ANKLPTSLSTAVARLVQSRVDSALALIDPVASDPAHRDWLRFFIERCVALRLQCGAVGYEVDFPLPAAQSQSYWERLHRAGLNERLEESLHRGGTFSVTPEEVDGDTNQVVPSCYGKNGFKFAVFPGLRAASGALLALLSLSNCIFLHRTTQYKIGALTTSPVSSPSQSSSSRRRSNLSSRNL